MICKIDEAARGFLLAKLFKNTLNLLKAGREQAKVVCGKPKERR